MNILTDFCALIIIAENSRLLLKQLMQLYRNELKRDASVAFLCTQLLLFTVGKNIIRASMWEFLFFKSSCLPFPRLLERTPRRRQCWRTLAGEPVGPVGDGGGQLPRGGQGRAGRPHRPAAEGAGSQAGEDRVHGRSHQAAGGGDPQKDQVSESQRALPLAAVGGESEKQCADNSSTQRSALASGVPAASAPCCYCSCSDNVDSPYVAPWCISAAADLHHTHTRSLWLLYHLLRLFSPSWSVHCSPDKLRCRVCGRG